MIIRDGPILSEEVTAVTKMVAIKRRQTASFIIYNLNSTTKAQRLDFPTQISACLRAQS